MNSWFFCVDYSDILFHRSVRIRCVQASVRVTYAVVIYSLYVRGVHNMTSRTSYGRSELFACRRTSRVSGLDRESLLTQIASLGILHYRGRRAGAKRKTRPSTWIQRVDGYDHGLTLNDQNKVNHIPVIHRVPHSNVPRDPRKRYLVSIPVTPQSSLVIGSLNVQSLANKAAAIQPFLFLIFQALSYYVIHQLTLMSYFSATMKRYWSS